MSTCIFRSAVAGRLQAFWEMRATGGYGYALYKWLRRLDHFLLGELKPGDTITRETVDRYFKSTDHLSAGTRINLMSALRQFCLYQSHFDPRTCIVHGMLLPRRNLPKPYIYSPAEIRQIMAAAPETKRSHDPLRPVLFATLVGFLYATGLRIGEAIKLNLSDVDVRRQLVLVREAKFKKTRYVPLTTSTTRCLNLYLAKRRAAGFSQDPASPFFPSSLGGRYHAATFTKIFLDALRRLGLRGPAGQRGPRIHDLRHSFAVSRLMAWHKNGDNLLAKLPLLSTYLGHSTVTGTEVYLHATAELMESVGQRFHDHFAVPSVRSLCDSPNSQH